MADEESLRAFDDSLEVDCDNLDNDPDWTKTPLYKKLQTLKVNFVYIMKTKTKQLNNATIPPKT